MKLHQLRYLAAVVQNGLNITTAARKLHTSQPGVSKQLKLLEDELGFPLFERDGRNLTGVTAAGQQVVDRALRILEEAQNIRRLSADLKDDKSGSLSIGTTHTQARYVLPPIVQQFRAGYADVDLHLHQGSTEQIAELAKLDRIDFAIATGGGELFAGLVLLPCYRWQRRVVVPRGHPLAKERAVSLEALARYPIVTYTFSFGGRSSLPALFESAGLKLRVALTASDADVIKTYVRLGLGVGIVAEMAVRDDSNSDLVVRPMGHIFGVNIARVAFKRSAYLRNFVFKFAELLSDRLDRNLIAKALSGHNQDYEL
jgi:LysR family transcriptional regulator, cys regulon transcriptional activator